MKNRWEQVENVSYLSVKDERSYGKMNHSEVEFRVKKTPYKAVLRLNNDGDRPYVLYDTEKSVTKALYIPDGFPYKNLWLDIHGDVFRGDNHYTVTNGGFEFIFDILERELSRNPEYFQCKTNTRSGRFVMEANVPNFRYVPYTARNGETVLRIADKLGVSAYLILERNSAVDGFLDDCTGLTLMVPNQFARRVVVEISPELRLPVYIEVYDDKGLLERFQYKDIRVNTPMSEDLFTEDYIENLD